MAEENKTIDEKFLSEPFEKLSQLPRKKEEISDVNVEEAEKLFADIIESVKKGDTITIAEYNLLSSIHKLYDFNTFLNKLDDDKKLAIASELKTVADRKVIYNFTRPINTTSIQDRKKEIKKRIAVLNDALASSDGNFTADQVKQLQSAISGFSAFTVKEKDPKTKEETEKTYKIPVQTYFADFKPAKGKKLSPAFTMLYNQAYPDTEPEPADIFASRLESVGEELAAQNTTDEQEQETVVSEAQTENQTDEPQTEEQDEQQEVQDEQEPQPQAEEESEITVTEEEIESYIAELTASENEDNYLKSIDPKISMENIEMVMSLQEMSDKAAAIMNPDDMLVAFNYYATSNDDNASQKLQELKEVIAYNLTENCDKGAITPDNAYVYALLADKIKEADTEAYKAAKTKIATALKTYDNEHFGTLDDKELSVNYGAVMQGLEELDANAVGGLLKGYSFTDDKGEGLEDKNRAVLNPARLVSGKGNKLSDTHKRIIETARLMVAEELAKDGLPKEKKGADGQVITVEQQLLEKMDEKIKIILAPKPTAEIENAAKLLASKVSSDENSSEYKNAVKLNITLLMDGNQDALKAAVDAIAELDGKGGDEAAKKEIKDRLTQSLQQGKTFNETEMGARFAAYTTELEQFKKRINQKADFKDGSLYKRVTPLLQQLDEKLTERYQEKYTTPKKFLQTYGKMAVNSAKSAGLFTAASFIPGAVPALIARNTYRQIKSMKKELQNPDFTKTQKALMWTAVVATTALTAASFIPGVGGVSAIAVKTVATTTTMLLPNYFKKKNLQKQKKHLADHRANLGSDGKPTQAALEAHAQKVEKLKSRIADIKELAENGGIGQAFNNMLGRNKRKLNKLMKEMEVLEKDKPLSMVEIIAKEKAISLQQKKNKREMLQKGAGVAIGMVIGQTANAAVHDAFTSDNAPSVTSENTNNAPSATSENTNNAPSATSENTDAAKPIQLSENETAQSLNMFDQHNPFSAEFKLNSFGFGLDGDSNAETQEVKPPYLNAEAQAAAEAEMQAGTPDDLHGAKAPESELTDEQKAQNLAAAEEKGSGHIGKSDMESMQKDLDSKDGAKLGYTSEEKAALMKSLAEGFGTDSYEAMHAAMAEPRILAAQMGITTDVDAYAQAAGIPEGDYSKAVLNYLAEHPELANNEGFKAYVAEHFDAQDRFHSNNYTVHTETHHQSASQQPASQETLRETKITYTRVDHLPGERPTDFRHEPVQGHHEPQQTVYEPVIPPHGIAVNGAMAYVNGQEYHQSMEFSNKLGYTLNDRAILGVYQNNHNPDDFVMITAPLDHHGHPIPDGRLTATHHTYEYLRDAQEQAHTGYERQSYKMQPLHGGSYGYGYGTRVCYGNGGISQTDITYAKVSTSAHILGDMAYVTGGVLDAIGENGKTAYKVGTVAHGAGAVTSGIGDLHRIWSNRGGNSGN